MHAVQKLICSLHSLQDESQFWQVPEIAVVPLGQLVMHWFWKRIPVGHLHTPLTAFEGHGQALTQTFTLRKNPKLHWTHWLLSLHLAQLATLHWELLTHLPETS